MIKNYPNSRLASSVQCDRCGRRVYTAEDSVEGIVSEFRGRGWLMGSLHYGKDYCQECSAAMRKDKQQVSEQDPS